MPVVKFRIVGNDTCDLEIDEPTVIGEVKAMLLDFVGKEGGNVRLVFKGQVLKNDEAPLGDFGVFESPDSYVVAIISGGTPKVVQTPNTTADIITPAAPVQPAAQPTVPASAVPFDLDGAVEEDVVIGENPEPVPQPVEQPRPVGYQPTDEEITNLMGFTGATNETATLALRCARGNLDAAATFCLDGIPPQLIAQLNAAEEQAAVQNPEDANANENIEVHAFPSLEETEAPEGQGPPSTGLRARLEAMDGFQNLRSEVRDNPQLIDGILSAFNATNPSLFQECVRNLPEFLTTFLTEEQAAMTLASIMARAQGSMGAGPAPGQGPAPGRVPPAQIEVTEEENNIIRNLMEMTGLSRPIVVQVFIACDRNGDLAAMNLLENLDQYQQDMAAAQPPQPGNQ
ncbi:hypothetical protein PCE1_000357 [Barthelona sp. PCE]